jgi:hypothetical protein
MMIVDGVTEVLLAIEAKRHGRRGAGYSSLLLTVAALDAYVLAGCALAVSRPR